MSWIFSLCFLFIPITAYANYEHSFEKHIYGNYTVHFTIRIPTPKTPEFVDYIPSLMTIYINSFSVIQYPENNFNIVLYKLNWKEVKIGVRYYF